MTDTMKKLAVLLIGTLFVLCVAIVLAVSLPVSTAFAAEGEPEATVHDHTDGTWTELTSDGGTLQSGNYYLAGDVTLTTDITIADNTTVVLCLNGYTLTGTGTDSVITVSDDASFTLTDCRSASEEAECQHSYYVAESGLWTFYDGDLPEAAPDGAETGVVTGGVITGGNGLYGGVDMIDGTFTMNGGTISDNTATNDGGGVYVDQDGTFNMSDGTISGNTATNYDGGGVYMDGTFTMTGGTISDNTANRTGGGVYVTGSNSKFTLENGIISGNTATNGGGVYFDGGNTFEMSGGTISGNTATNGGGIYFYGAITFEMNGGTITGNTASSNGGGVYVPYGMFTLEVGTITDNSATDGGGVYIDRGMFTLESGTVSGNTASSNGGGVYTSSLTTLTLEDGTISGNFAYAGGGGVYMSGGKSTMNGGTISGNSALVGGGMYIYGGTFTMNGGTISGDRTFIGSGLHVNDSNGTFTMNGGYLGEDIENNGTVSISGGYFAEEFDTAYLAENCAAHDISAFGTALDSDYIAGFPYAVYASGMAQITASANDNIVYDGSPVAAGTDFTVTGADGVEFTYVYKTAGGEFISGLPTNAGEYTVSGYGLNGEKQFFSVEFDITVAKADYDMSGITFADDSVPYNGEEQSLAISGDLPAGVTVTYDGNGNTNVGEYTVTAKFAVSDANYNEIDDMTAKLTITKATYDMSGIKFEDDSVPYNGEEQSLIVSGTLPAGVTVTYDGNGKVNAGEYTVTASFAGDYDNYNAIADKTATLTIEKGVPSYTAPTELTVSVGQNIADITLPDGWEWTDGAVQFGTAGEHKAVAVYTAADTANYAPVMVELTISVSESEPTDPDQPGGEITSEEPEGLSGGAIAGIVIGCILGVLLIEYGVFALLYKKKLISGAFFGKIYPFIKD